MHYNRVYLESIGYELPPVVISTTELEARLKPIYDAHRLPMGQLELLTGIAHRDAGDSASLIEWGGGILAALITCMMFCAAIFLAVEPVLGNGLATAVGLAGGSVLTLVSPMLFASLIRRAQRLQ